LKVDENALASVYPFPVTINSEAKTVASSTGAGGVVTSVLGFSQSDSINLKVDGTSILVPSLAGMTPYLIDPGQQATVTVKLYNNGSDIARNVRLSVDSIPGLTVSSGSEDIYLGEISPKASATAAVSFEMDSEAESRTYPLPMAVSYDGSSSPFTADIKVRESARIEISEVLYDSGLITDKPDQPIQLRIRNAGNRKAEDLTFILVAEYPFTPTGRSNFLTSLEPGEEKTIGFFMGVDAKAVSQTYPAQVMMTWREGERNKSSIRGFSIFVQKNSGLSYIFLIGGVAVLTVVFLAFIKMKKKGPVQKSKGTK